MANKKIFCTAQKMKFFIKDFFSKCDQIRSFLKKEILYGKLHFLCSGECLLLFIQEKFYFVNASFDCDIFEKFQVVT